jgi:hypothetical protein
MYWYSAYIRSHPGMNLPEDIRRTDFERSKVGIVHPGEFNGLLYHEATSWKLVILSPIVDGWTVMWGSTSTFHQIIFQANGYSGLILEVEDDKDYDLWTYQLWDKGLLLDWFVSDPVSYFRAWKMHSLERDLMPYLRSRIKQPITTSDFHEIVQNSRDVFLGDINLLQQMHLFKSKIPILTGTVANSFPLPARGFMDFLSALDLPYANMDFDPEEIGIYLDIETGRMDLSKYTDFVDIYHRIKSLPDIDKFSVWLLDVKKQDEGKIFYV